MCSRVHQSADPFVLRNLIEKPDALPSQDGVAGELYAGDY